MRRLAWVLVTGFGLLSGLFSACGVSPRPEGAVEDWLTTLNQGAAGEPGKYASRDATAALLAGWDTCDPGAFDRIEVGKGTPGAGSVFGETYFVPYGVEYASDLESVCERPGRPRAPLKGVADVAEINGDWRVLDLIPRAEGPSGLVLPSEGGRRVGGASTGQWLLALGLTALLTAAVALLMRFAPPPAFQPSYIAAGRDAPGE